MCDPSMHYYATKIECSSNEMIFVRQNRKKSGSKKVYDILSAIREGLTPPRKTTEKNSANELQLLSPFPQFSFPKVLARGF